MLEDLVAVVEMEEPAKFTYPDGARTLTIRVGNRGNGGTSGGTNAFGTGGSSTVADGGNGGGAGQNGWSGGGGGGGGASGVYDSETDSYTIVAGGGGGGGGGSHNRGGSGGGTADGFSTTTSVSVSDGSVGQTKSGDGGGGGGGGGGATGGTGGSSGQDNSYGGHGGTGAGSKYVSSVATLDSQWENDGDGYINLKFTTATDIPGVTVTRTVTNVVSGTNTETLTIRSDSVGIQTVSVRLTQSDATNSPLTSDTVNFAAVSDANQYNVNVEAIGIANTATLSSVNLFNGDYTFYTSGSDAAESRITNYYSIYAPDKDLSVEMDLYGGKGYDKGSYTGGEGGFSRVRFTMEQNVEYVIAGLSTSVNAPFVYRKAQLIAAVGGGGDAGGSGNGGFGGGVGVSGEGGSGRGAGSGGSAFDAGTLPANGIFGSRTSLTATAPDTSGYHSFRWQSTEVY